jgi:methylated-DNA-[protein]-cysteine S-methyltransferase
MRFCLVDTAIGSIGLAWSPRGLRRVLLPHVSRAATAAKLARFAEPARAQQVPRFLLDAIEAYGEGKPTDFSATILDLRAEPDFHRSVYDDILKVGWGETTTYGEIALRLGDAKLARAVGQALGRNPIPLIIPCHRVLASGGKAGGFSAPGGTASKLKMLALEGIRVGPPPSAQLAFAF